MTVRDELFHRGAALVAAWCRANEVTPPEVVVSDDPVRYGTCAYYRADTIYIHPPGCATFGNAGRSYSWPGYVVDRTPYGVMAHELAHHVDRAWEQHPGRYSTRLRRDSGEAQLTSYCDNDYEWFAELFRLFVTNPDLLRELRPYTFGYLYATFPCKIETRNWHEVLADAPRQLRAAQNKINEVHRIRWPRQPRAKQLGLSV